MNEFKLLAFLCLLVAGVESKSKFVTVNLDAKWKSTPIMLETRYVKVSSTSFVFNVNVLQCKRRCNVICCSVMTFCFWESIGHLASTLGCLSPRPLVTDRASNSSTDVWHVNLVLFIIVLNCNTNT